MKLVIVESPTKIKSFQKILSKNKEYEFFATLGHIRDLPPKQLGVKVEDNFKPIYKILSNKSEIVKNLKRLGKQAEEIILATDPDREGESIAYHAAYFLGFIKENWPEFDLKQKNKLKRIIFHEITPQAIRKALATKGNIRESLVKAQFARRILDRLVGYKLSPLLWKKIGKNWLSAGRVQTVALRLIVEREKERENFVSKKYFLILGQFKNSVKIEASLKKLKGKNIEKKEKLKLFAGDYVYSYTTINQENVENIINRLKNEKYQISEIEEKTVKRLPPPPLTTSLMQQEAARSFRYTSKYAMRIAQDLYERGFITYHRTDSYNLASSFIRKARKFIEKELGKDYVVNSVRKYKTKSKLAQEAHEAIRPTNPDLFPQSLNFPKITQAHRRLYELIWKRAIATQMREAEIKILKIKIKSKSEDLFVSRFEWIVFPGFLKLFGKDKQDKIVKKEFKVGDKLKLISLERTEKNTLPPPRYTEALLIKTLEEKGIGRPSTYAPIISLLQTRRYVEKKENYFIPTLLGKTVCRYLVNSFPNIFSLTFTAKMEDSLDEVANGKKIFLKILENFYYPFEEKLEEVKKEKGFINVEETTDEKCPKCGKNLVIRFSKYGKFLACSGYPECKYIKNFQEKVGGIRCPKCGGEVIVRRTKKGRRFYGCSNYPKCDWSVWKLSDVKK